MDQRLWFSVAASQQGLVSRRQLRRLGINHDHVRSQIRARRWSARGTTVISTFTGELTWLHRCWLGVLHAGGPALVGGLTAATLHGLEHWNRSDVSILVPDNVVLDPLPGIRWVRTRRNLTELKHPGLGLPTKRLEPAILMFGAADRSPRTAVGVLAAAIQQRLTTPASLLTWIERLRPLRRAKLLSSSVVDFAGGSQSLGEVDVIRMCRKFGLARPTRQARRRDASGRWRFRDCEWQLPAGGAIALEVDGSFHMEAAHWHEDIQRERDLAARGRMTIRCTTFELRTSPESVARALLRLGVPAAR